MKASYQTIMNTGNNKRRGSALIMVMVCMGLMFVIAISSYYSVLQQSRYATRSLHYQQALALAEAGVEIALAELNNNENARWVGWSGSGSNKTLKQSLTSRTGEKIGEFDVTVTNPTESSYIINSKGIVDSITGPQLVRNVKVRAIATVDGGSVDPEIPSLSWFGQYGLYTRESFTNNANNTWDHFNAYNSAEGPYNKNDSKYDSKLAVGVAGNAQFHQSAKINGSLTVAGNITGDYNNIKKDITKTIKGGVFPGESITVPDGLNQLPQINASIDTAKVTNNNKNIEVHFKEKGVVKVAKPFGPGSPLVSLDYQKIAQTVKNSNNQQIQTQDIEKVVLPAGVYHFKNISIEKGVLDVVGGPATIYLSPDNNNQAMFLGNQAHLNTKAIAPYEYPRPTNLSIVVDPRVTSTAQFNSGQSNMYASIFAPGMNLYNADSIEIWGALLLKNFSANSGFKFHADLSVLANTNSGSTGGETAAGEAGAFVDWWVEKKPS